MPAIYPPQGKHCFCVHLFVEVMYSEQHSSMCECVSLRVVVHAYICYNNNNNQSDVNSHTVISFKLPHECFPSIYKFYTLI